MTSLRYGLPTDSELRQVVATVSDIANQLAEEKKILKWESHLYSAGRFESQIIVAKDKEPIRIIYTEAHDLFISYDIENTRSRIDPNQIKDKILVMVDQVHHG